MATIVFTDAYVSLGGNVVSDHVTQVTINYSAEMLDETAMGDTTRINKGGLKQWSINVDLHQDFASANIDSIFFPLVGTAIAFEIRPTPAAVGTSNPKYTGTGILENFPPLGNGVGELGTASITLQSASTLARATA